MASDTSTAAITQRPREVWWLIGVVVLLLCIIFQMPASWLVAKLMPNSPYLQHVSGNLWRGSGVMQLPSQTTKAAPVLAQVQWQWRPLLLFTGQLGYQTSVVSGQTRLAGTVGRGLSAWHANDISGSLAKDTLTQFVDWQMPEAPIQVNALSMTVHLKTDTDPMRFADADGQLTWAGGMLGYPSGGQTFDIIMPAMRADVQTQDKQGAAVVHMNLVDDNSKRLGDFYLDNQGMLDVNLTQRLLENMPSYSGSAPADTAVVSIRQPLPFEFGRGQ